jgi:D-alanyl-lipoteichoic acid acyltransferase DltB (MBOAT superfamily)
MLLIGLWHGVTWNFAIWGAWHGVGLFVHSRFSEWSRPRQSWLQERPRLEKLGRFTAWLITFNYINLGWVWFALPTPKLAWQVYRVLFGAAS